MEFVPDFSLWEGAKEEVRELAKELSETCGDRPAKYCFQTDIQNVDRMEEEGVEILFPSLNYKTDRINSHESKASLPNDISLKWFETGWLVTKNSTNDLLKSALRYHSEKVSGPKHELVKRVASLCSKLAKKYKPKLDKFFKDRYLRIDSSNGSENGQQFPITLEKKPETSDNFSDEYFDNEGDTPLKGNIITQYIIRHLRGERFLDRLHVNNSYDEQSLAKVVLNREVKLEGVFIKISQR